MTLSPASTRNLARVKQVNQCERRIARAIGEGAAVYREALK
jgi:hypothetical protein